MVKHEHDDINGNYNHIGSVEHPIKYYIIGLAREVEG